MEEHLTQNQTEPQVLELNTNRTGTDNSRSNRLEPNLADLQSFGPNLTQTKVLELKLADLQSFEPKSNRI